ncbi:hypothetical protein NDU88_002719 [Pleurodeles waltl]|uniref:Uncharacterized protein n=1 Tax=Pleurodeles waltl TaxID=8319 RepID=A0AAV7KVI6_PLEWA|nr:hypothetical protein NDU88_002719 [Pleurodeles waltl]
MKDVVCGAKVGTRSSIPGRDTAGGPAEELQAAAHSKNGEWLLEQAGVTGERHQKKGCFVPAPWSPGDTYDTGCLQAGETGVSKDFYDPEDLQRFLDSLQPQSMDTTTPDWPLRQPSDNRSTSPPSTNQEGPD